MQAQVQQMSACLEVVRVYSFCSTSSYSLSINNSIRVEHGDYLEDVGLSQAGCQRAGAHQELQCALHYPAGVGLSRVHSGCQEDQWAIPWRERESVGANINNTYTEGGKNENKRFFNLKFFRSSTSQQQWAEDLLQEMQASSDTPKAALM